MRNKTLANAKSKFYQYSVDVLSGWIYYTPVYALQELLAGHDPETVAKTRAIGLLIHALVMRPVGLSRNYVAKRLGVTKESSCFEKWKVNLLGVTPIQMITYAVILITGMAWSGNYDVEAAIYAWTVGVTLGALHGLIYGHFQDKFRKACGVEVAIK